MAERKLTHHQNQYAGREHEIVSFLNGFLPGIMAFLKV